MFEQPGEYDETSVFHMFRDRNLVILDQSIKANRQLAQLQASDELREAIVDLDLADGKLDGR